MSNLNPADVWAWLQDNGSTLANLGAVLAGAAMLVVLGLGYRTGGVEKVAKMVAVPLVVAGEMEGLFELLHKLAGLPVDMSLILCGMTSSVLAALMSMAHKHHLRHGTLGPNKRTLIYVGGTVGLLVAGTASSLSVAGLRILVPMLGIILLIASYRPDEPAGEDRKTGGVWVWTPRRIAARLGLITPGEGDIVTLAHERGVRQLVRAQFALRYGGDWLRSRRQMRLRRVARNADDAMVQAAYAQMQRIDLVIRMSAPGYVPPTPEGDPKSDKGAGETPHTPKPSGSGGAVRAKKAGEPAKKWVPAPVLVERVKAYEARNPGSTWAEAARALGYDTRHVQKTMKAAQAEENTAPVPASAPVLATTASA